MTDYEDDGNNCSDIDETALLGLPLAGAQNNSHRTGSQEYPMNQSLPLSIDSKNDHGKLYKSPYMSSFSTVEQNSFQGTVNQKPRIGHTSPKSDHSVTNPGSSMSQFSLWSNPSSNDYGSMTSTFSSISSSASAQGNTSNAVKQESAMHGISLGSGHKERMPESRVTRSSLSNPFSDGHMKKAENIPSSHSSAATQSNIRDWGNQTLPAGPPEPDNHKGIPVYAAEAFRNTIKSSLAALCSDFMATAHSDIPRARRDLEELKEITKQYFSTTESAFDSIRDRADT